MTTSDPDDPSEIDAAGFQTLPRLAADPRFSHARSWATESEDKLRGFARARPEHAEACDTICDAIRAAVEALEMRRKAPGIAPGSVGSVTSARGGAPRSGPVAERGFMPEASSETIDDLDEPDFD